MLPGRLAETLGGPAPRKKQTVRPTAPNRPTVTVRPPTNPYVSNGPTLGSQQDDTSNLQQALAKQFTAPEYVAPQLHTNYDADPTLQRIRALGTKNVADAQAEALKLKQQAVIDTGAADVGQRLGLDANTVQAASANPFSQTALLQKQYEDAVRQNTEARNQENLFYSGQRATDLTNLGTDQAKARADLNSQLEQLLGQADQGVVAAQTNAQQQEAAQLESQAQAQAQQDYQNQVAAQQAAFQNQLAQQQAEYQNNLMLALAQMQPQQPTDYGSAVDSQGAYVPPPTYDPVAQPGLAYRPASDPFLQAMASPNPPQYVRDPETHQLIPLF